MLEVIKALSSTRYPGPSRSFTEIHVIRALQILGEKKTIGRTLLSQQLNLGPGAVRTLIGSLERRRLITVNRAGCRLTEQGLKIYRELIEKIPGLSEINAGRLSFDKFDAAAVMRNASHLIRYGLEQRDTAIKAGAKGATTLVYEGGKFTIPRGSRDCAKDFPGDIWRMFKEKFKLREGDVIIVSSAGDRTTALHGALAGALTLLD